MKRSIFTAATDSILIILAFIIFINSILEIKDTIYLKATLNNNIFQNANLQPIELVNVGRVSCPEDDEELFYFKYFTGIEEGSYNTDTKEFSNIKCDEYDISCKNIPEISPQVLEIWEDKVLCLKRLTTGINITYVIVNSTTDCPNEFKMCGYYNNFNDKICGIKNKECMINHISISNKRPLNNSYGFYEIGQNKYLIYSNNATNEIIPIDFAIGDEYPCIENNRISYNEKDGYFPTTYNLSSYGCNSTDETGKLQDDGLDRRYRILDTMVKRNFYENNDLLKKYIKLPNVYGWNNDLDSNIYLFIRNYVSFNYSCINHYNYERFLYDLERTKLFNYTHLCGCLGNLVVICLFVSFLSLFKIVEKKRCFHLIGSFLKIFCCTVFIVFNFVYSHRGIGKVEKLSYFLEIFEKKECIQEEMRNGYNRYLLKSVITDMYSYVKLFYYFCGLYALLNILQLIRLIYKTCLRIKLRTRTKLAKKLLS